MKTDDLCPCCSGKTYFNCCQLAHLDHSKANTAEALMRSRYCAYALHNADYLLATTHETQRKLYCKNELLEWATQNEWIELQIISAAATVVEFKAWYRNEKQMLCVHHERSTFTHEVGFWYYVDGIFL
ncbi:YchJ family protein [Flavobacterium sp. GNP001]